MPQPPLLRWGLIFLSLGAAALAFFLHPDLKLSNHAQSILQHPFFPGGQHHNQQTFCYEGVKGADGSNDGGNGIGCFIVEDGKFTSVFTPSKEEPATVLPGYAYPGLWDGHGHLLQYGEFLHSINLFGSTTFDEVRGRVRSYLDNHPGAGGKNEWIRGVGWDQMRLGQMPSADMLESDPLLKGLYIMLDRVDVHCIWVSQAVLSLLPDDLADVPGGEIIRNPGMGVFCDNAMEMVTALWPRPGPEKKKEYLRSAMRDLHSVGLVGMHDAGVTPTELQLYEQMAREDDGWTLRVYAMIECKERNTFCPDEVQKVELDNGLLFVRSVKLFADGALGSWGSAMLAPYSDRPDTTGSLLVNASTLTSVTNSWAAAGYQVNIHAIGDLANRLAIDAFESALQEVCPPGQDLKSCQLASHRFRIEHAQIIHPSDQSRMRNLGILPSIQPTHATSDSAYAGLRLGPERTRTEAYRMRSVWDLSPVLGSDFPVEPANPFAGMYAAVTRRRPDTGVAGPPGSSGGWCVDEALQLEQALTGFTEAPARGAFLDQSAGKIANGFWADWIVLEDKLENMDVDALRNVKVKETWVGGKKVYGR